MPNPCPVAQQHHHDAVMHMHRSSAMKPLSHEQQQPQHMTVEEHQHAVNEQQMLATEHHNIGQAQIAQHSLVAGNVAMFAAAAADDHSFYMTTAPGTELEQEQQQQQRQQEQDHHEMLMYLSKDHPGGSFHASTHHHQPAPSTYMDLDVLGGSASGMYGALSLGLDPMDFGSPMDLGISMTTMESDQHNTVLVDDPTFFEPQQENHRREHHHHQAQQQPHDMLDMFENASAMSTCPSDRAAGEGEDFYILFDNHPRHEQQLAGAAADQYRFPALECQEFAAMQLSLQHQQRQQQQQHQQQHQQNIELELDPHGVPVHLVSLADIETTAPPPPPPPPPVATPTPLQRPQRSEPQVDRFSQLRNSKSYPPPLHFKSRKALENMGVVVQQLDAAVAPAGGVPPGDTLVSLSSSSSPQPHAGAARLEHPRDDEDETDIKSESGSDYEPQSVDGIKPVSVFDLATTDKSWKLPSSSSPPATAFDKLMLLLPTTRDDDVDDDGSESSPLAPVFALQPMQGSNNISPPRKKISDSSLMTTATASSFGESIVSAAATEASLSSTHWDAATARCSDTQTVYLFVNETSKVADVAAAPPPDDPETNPAAFASEDGFKCVCGKLFKKLYNLKNHYKMHAVDKPYICDVCQRGFMRKHDLKRHATTHLQDFRPYECEDCHTPFTRLDALHRHIRARRCRAV
ncbi:hypothetical protein HDU86_005754 [Geranomyces michiganensis]|nr:hypothetical protein HDU86_005754 [Geranomyces michiganensis]